MKTNILNISLLITMVFQLPLFAQNNNQQDFFNAIETNDTKRIKEMVIANPALVDSSLTTSQYLTSHTYFPIHLAIMRSSAETIIFLIDLGADFSRVYSRSALMSHTSKTSLELLIEYRNRDFLELIIPSVNVSAKAITSSIYLAYELQKYDIVEYLLEIAPDYLLPKSEK